MKNNLIVAALLIAGTEAYAEEPCDLGLESTYLNDYFCSEFQEIAGLGLRSMTDETDTSDTGLDPTFAEFGVIKDAYRTDPKKTLDLIQRIRSAGGLLEE